MSPVQLHEEGGKAGLGDSRSLTGRIQIDVLVEDP